MDYVQCEQKDRCPEDTVNEEECAYLSICTMCQGRGKCNFSQSSFLVYKIIKYKSTTYSHLT